MNLLELRIALSRDYVQSVTDKTAVVKMSFKYGKHHNAETTELSKLFLSLVGRNSEKPITFDDFTTKSPEVYGKGVTPRLKAYFDMMVLSFAGMNRNMEIDQLWKLYLSNDNCKWAKSSLGKSTSEYNQIVLEYIFKSILINYDRRNVKTEWAIDTAIQEILSHQESSPTIDAVYLKFVEMAGYDSSKVVKADMRLVELCDVLFVGALDGCIKAAK